jgi:hypothetical protein
MSKGLGVKIGQSILGGVMFYLTMNKVEKLFNVKLSDE